MDSNIVPMNAYTVYCVGRDEAAGPAPGGGASRGTPTQASQWQEDTGQEL
jgi:hypothetical protein